MHGLDIDLTTVAYLGDDLIPRLSALRDEDPLYYSKASRCWIVTANDLVTEGFSGRLRLSAKRHELLAGLFTDPAERSAVIGYFMEVFPDFIVSTDPPYQSRLRKLLMGAFSKTVAEGLSGNPDRGLLTGANRAMLEMRDVFLAEITARGDVRGGDFLSQLLTARDGSDQLTRNEIIAQLILVLVAGHDTTLDTVALSIARLAKLPEERSYMRDHPENFEACIMELMRVVAMSAAQAKIVSADSTRAGRSPRPGRSSS